MVSEICYLTITKTGRLVLNTSVEYVTRYDYLKPDITSSIHDFNKDLKERLNYENFQVNADVDGKFNFILLDEDFR